MQLATYTAAEVFSIGELSRQTRVNIETIRYYERVKVLPVPPRTKGGRRIYNHHHTRTLAFIRRARNLGFTLEQIRTLLEMARRERSSCAEVRKLASHHLENIRTKLSDLAKLESILAKTIKRCSKNLSPVCPVLDILDAGNIA